MSQKAIGLFLLGSILFVSNPLRADTEVDVLYRIYEDEDTTVKSPSLDLSQTMLKDRLKLRGGYAADAVTSASSDVRTFGSKNPDGSSKEIEDSRQEFNFGADWAVSSSTFGAGYIQSDENDYHSKIVSFSATQEFFQKNTVVSVGFLNGKDKVQSSADKLFDEPMDHQTFNLSLTQLLTKLSLLQFIWDLRVENGFLSSPYRRARLSQDNTIIGVPENHPNTRNRSAFAVRYNYHFASIGLSASTVLRLYNDSWGVLSQTIEERLSQPLGKKWDFSLNLRYYNQKKAEFYEDIYSELQSFYTGNSTLGTFTSTVVGVRPTFKVTDNLYVYGKYELYDVNHKDTTDLGNAADPSDDKPLKIKTTVIGVGLQAKY